MLKNIPVVLEGYKLRVTEEPTAKTYTNDDGVAEMAVDPTTKTQLFVVSVLMKQRPSEQGGRVGKGFEVKVTLDADPGEIEEGQVVELIKPRISQWEKNGRNGVAVRATGLTPVG